MTRTLMTRLAGVAGVALLAVTGCSAAEEDSGGEGAEGSPSGAEDCAAAEHAMGLRWQQQSAEAQALQSQTYRIAGERLEEKVAEAEGENLAIISDLDETAVDNTALMARDMAACHDFSVWDTWGHWEREGQPTAIPGAVEFFRTADELGVSIFYISDRTEENLEDTVASLAELDFPQVSEESVKLLGPPKEERRAAVQQDHQVLMQLGDTLHDFSADYADAELAAQREQVSEDAARFGDDWFILPNPTYGSWEDADLETWDAEIQVEE